LTHRTPSAQHAGHFHAVRFYQDDVSLCRMVAEFIGEGLVTLQPAVVIATADHRMRIMNELRTRYFDVEALVQNGNLLLIDARQALAEFMVDGDPDANVFMQRADEWIQQVCKGRPDCTIRAYGEMVDLLWKDGQTVAAVRLEMLWNRLGSTRDFSLLCGYSMGNFYKGAAIDDICDQHTHVLFADGKSAPLSAAH
jgi:hypothetical protein